MISKLSGIPWSIGAGWAYRVLKTYLQLAFVEKVITKFEEEERVMY
jgi:hypothetical protein